MKDTKNILITIPSDLAENIKLLAKNNDRSNNKQINYILKKYFELIK